MENKTKVRIDWPGSVNDKKVGELVHYSSDRDGTIFSLVLTKDEFIETLPGQIKPITEKEYQYKIKKNQVEVNKEPIRESLYEHARKKINDSEDLIRRFPDTAHTFDAGRILAYKDIQNFISGCPKNE